MSEQPAAAVANVGVEGKVEEVTASVEGRVEVEVTVDSVSDADEYGDKLVVVSRPMPPFTSSNQSVGFLGDDDPTLLPEKTDIQRNAQLSVKDRTHTNRSP